MRWRSTAVVGCVVLACAPLRAGVTVGFDVPTLNELLPALTVQEVVVPLPGGGSVRVVLDDLEVRGFAPGADGRADEILTSVLLRVPALGLELPLEPRMSLGVVEEQGRSLLELRFERVGIPLPVAGSIDAAPFIAPFRFPADDVFQLVGARGEVSARSRLVSVQMRPDAVLFEFDVRIIPPAPVAPAGSAP